MRLKSKPIEHSMLRFILLTFLLLFFFQANSQTIQFKTFDKFCPNGPIITLDSFVNLNYGKWELISYNDSTWGSIEYFAARANMTDSTKITPSFPGKYFWRYTNHNSGNPLKDSVYMDIGYLPDLRSVRNPYPKCFGDGQFDLDSAYPIGANFNWSEKDSCTIWYTMQDARRDSMLDTDSASPYLYKMQHFFNPAKHGGGYIPSYNSTWEKYIDDLTIHVKHNTTGCYDSVDFSVLAEKNPLVQLRDIIERCQDAGSFRLNYEIVLAPNNPNGGIHNWEIDSAPAGLSQVDLDQILEDRNPSPFFVDYWFNPMHIGLPVTHLTNKKRIGCYKLKFCYESGITNCAVMFGMTI